jgi:hypothetical protein
MQKPKFTGPLILFIAWTGISGATGLGALDRAEKTWKPYMADHPSLQGAVLVFQLVAGAGLLACLYSAWLLYQREPGNLERARTSLLIGGFLRLVASWIIVIFGGLPADMVQRQLPQLTFANLVILLFTGGWYLYLLQSKKVREIYAG